MHVLSFIGAGKVQNFELIFSLGCPQDVCLLWIPEFPQDLEHLKIYESNHCCVKSRQKRLIDKKEAKSFIIYKIYIMFHRTSLNL